LHFCFADDGEAGFSSYEFASEKVSRWRLSGGVLMDWACALRLNTVRRISKFRMVKSIESP
jgi:hypothetical protein